MTLYLKYLIRLAAEEIVSEKETASTSKP